MTWQRRILQAAARALPGVPVEYSERFREDEMHLHFIATVEAGTGDERRCMGTCQKTLVKQLDDTGGHLWSINDTWNHVRRELLAAIESEANPLASDDALVKKLVLADRQRAEPVEIELRSKLWNMSCEWEATAHGRRDAGDGIEADVYFDLLTELREALKP